MKNRKTINISTKNKNKSKLQTLVGNISSKRKILHSKNWNFIIMYCNTRVVRSWNIFCLNSPRFVPPWDRPEERAVLSKLRLDSGSCRKLLPVVPAAPRWISSCDDASSSPSAPQPWRLDLFDRDEPRDRRPVDREAKRRRLPLLPRNRRNIN